MLLKKVGDLTLPIMLLSMVVGSLIFIFFKHIVLYYVASVLIGVSFVGTMSYIFYFISKIFEKEEIHLTIEYCVSWWKYWGDFDTCCDDKIT